MIDIIKIHWDAACDNNSKFKFMGLGVAVFVNDIYREELSKAIMYGTNGTNNIGEWAGLEEAIVTAGELKAVFPNSSIRLYGDSQLVVRQFNRIYRVKQEHLIPYFKSCRMKYLEVGNVISVEWIPREQNKEADELSKRAIKEFLTEHFTK